MSELMRIGIEKSKLFKKKPWLKPPSLWKESKNVDVVGQHRTRQHLRAYLREANPANAHLHPPLPDIEDNGQLRLLTRRLLGMRHEFKSYDKNGEQERRDFLKAGIIGAGLTAAGGLAGLGLYKAGVSGAAQKAAQIGGELDRARKSLRGIRDWKLAKVAAAKKAESVSRVASKKSLIANATAGIDAQKFRVERVKEAAKVAKEAAKSAPVAPKVVAPVVTKAAPVVSKAAPVVSKAAPVVPTPAPIVVTPAEIIAENTERLAAAPVKVAPAKAAKPAASVPVGPAPAPVAKGKAPRAPEAPEFWEKGGMKVPLNGSPEHNTALRKKLDELHGSGGFKGQVAGDVIDSARESVTKSLNPKSDFPPGLSDQLRAAGKANNPQKAAKATKKPSAKKAKEDVWEDPDASPDEAEWEAAYNSVKSAAPASRAVKTKAAPKKAAPAKPEKAPEAKAAASQYETPPLSPMQIRKLQAARRAKKANRIAKAEAAAKAAKKGKGKKKNLSALLRRVRFFDQFQTDEAGIPLTGRVAHDRLVKKIRDEDLDRRDANLLRAGGVGALAGLLARGRIGASKRALIGAGAGGLGVIGIRALTHNDRDIYGERNRGSKKAEIIPAVGGLGAAAWFAGKRLKAFAAKFNHNRAPGQAGGRATEGWPRRGETRGSERVKGHGGVKEFDDYRLYYFKGRNTGIAARSAEEARKKKKRGGDELVAVRTPSDSEKSQMARGVWVRTRRDGKSPGQSRYGKGRGQGPARKSMGARLSKIKFFAEKSEKRGLNPYAGAALSGAASGAALGGGLSLLTKGESLKTLAPWKNAGKAALHGGLLSAGIVGGGALLGSKIIGKPHENESSAFTKRAAVGGALIGAGLGLGGGLLKNTAPVSKWLAKSAESGAFSRPASWLLKTNIPQAAAFGTVAGGLYGGVHAGEEGMQVDSIRNLRKDMKKFPTKVKGREFSAKLRLFGRNTQPRNAETMAFTGPIKGWVTGEELVNNDGTPWRASSPQLVNAMMREAARQRTTVQRGGRFTRDAAAVLQGKDRERDASGRIKKREWEKSWFKNKATEIGLGLGGLGVAAMARYGHMNPNSRIGKAYWKARESGDKTAADFSKVTGGLMNAVNNATDPRRHFSAKLKRLRELDAIAEYAGWDIRDPRGKSARVFAPGSRKRERRQKEWHEKTENERKLWKSGIAAGVLGGAGLALVGQRVLSGKSLIPSRFIPKQPNPDVFVDATKVFRAGA
jgi:hypothetical protein